MISPDQEERLMYLRDILKRAAAELEDLDKVETEEKYELLISDLSINIGKISYVSELLFASGDLDDLTLGVNMIAEAEGAQRILKFQSLGLLSMIAKGIREGQGGGRG